MLRRNSLLAKCSVYISLVSPSCCLSDTAYTYMGLPDSSVQSIGRVPGVLSLNVSLSVPCTGNLPISPVLSDMTSEPVNALANILS